MCQYCQNFKPIMENENSILFIVAGRLILQDKTKPKGNGNYESTWFKIKYCPVCERVLS